MRCISWATKGLLQDLCDTVKSGTAVQMNLVSKSHNLISLTYPVICTESVTRFLWQKFQCCSKVVCRKDSWTLSLWCQSHHTHQAPPCENDVWIYVVYFRDVRWDHVAFGWYPVFISIRTHVLGFPVVFHAPSRWI